ncbi:hypothetical protein TRVA0_003S02718 [Trichomonascus vanleenenianus]|uniref:U4/U6-U5 snRNP complex subunit SNU23 n=1 Tax=Trichomonascus vanleenenianus TaxID=2268995 RepID=UPI003ECACCCD
MSEGKKKIRYVPQQEGATEAIARQGRLNFEEGLGKVTLVPGGVSGAGKRGKGAGFYCAVCDLTFKDSIQYTDHINSRQHLHASGQKVGSKRATLEEVQARLKYLKGKQEKEQRNQVYDIKKRIEMRRQVEEEELRKKRERNARRKRAARQRESSQEDQISQDIASVMGFSGFGKS